MELNFVLIISFLANNNFIIKFNKTELYALSGIYKNYDFLYSKCFELLVLQYIYFYKCSSTNFLIYRK